MHVQAERSGAAENSPQLRRPFSEPSPAFWRSGLAYEEAVEALSQQLCGATAPNASPPLAVQLAVLEQLHWYFTVDSRERAPTASVTNELAASFHERVSSVMSHIDPGSLELMSPAASAEVKYALLSYKGVSFCSPVSIGRHDDGQRLLQLTYWLSNRERPAEEFWVDGRRVAPAYAKYRSCRYLRRDLLSQRIVWLPFARDWTNLLIRIGGIDWPALLGASPFSVHALGVPWTAPPQLIGSAAGGGSSDWRLRLKARAVKAIARLPQVRRGFRDAWVFMDREHNADDNAEHLYRWVRKEHPEINAWFLLEPGCDDWNRLEREGFRLMPPGAARKLLMLNSSNFISSHLDSALGGFDKSLYGDVARWRFTYLKHGVMHNDQSHYYRGRQFDRLIAASPAEYSALVSDGTPYELTAREVLLCNLPRYDRLLARAAQISPTEIDQVTVMPTWRNNLIDPRLEPSERHRRVKASTYLGQWKAFLVDDRLRELANKHGKRIVFVPHSNLLPYMDAFALPEHVTIARMGTASIQEHLIRSCAFVTDYTSVAFDVALLRRAVFYFQFDREAFFCGDHNWRPGYFDYDRDGFGPVARLSDQLIDHLVDFFRAGASPSPDYLDRMERALPDRNADACRRVFESIRSLRRPFGSAGTSDSSIDYGI